MRKNWSLHSKLLVFAISISVVSMMFGFFFTLKNNKKMSHIAAEGTLEIAYEDLDHIVENVFGMSFAHNQLAQEMIANALKIARNTMENTGTVSFLKDEKVEWQAINQFTKESTSISLPKMMVGDQWLGQNRNAGQPSLIVDKTRDLSIETCTIFQRMNEKGDMLRVSTNVMNLAGARAIGTFIPATNPDGALNPVISTVLGGKTFNGRAYVVNAWYLTAYEPIYDSSKYVIGILYVGIKQSTLENALIEQIAKIRIGKTGCVYILNSKGEYIVSKDNKRNGETIWESKDSAGNLYIQEIIEKAKKLTAEESVTYRYLSGDNGERPRSKIVKLKYFKQWDWIIAAEVSENEVLTVRDKIIQLGKRESYQFSFISVFIVLLATAISFFFARSLTRPVMDVAKGLNNSASQVASASGQVSSASQSLADGSSEQAASIEKTSSSLEEMSAMTRQNADNANQAHALMTETRKVVDSANDAMTQMTESMKEISRASEETSKIVKTIDEIAFQTNLLALNASVEAARAGEAGAGFAVVANEVRNLAMRAADAARNTADLIEGTVKKVKEGAELVDRTNKAFQQVSTSSTKAGQLVGEIAVSSNEQALGIDQISKAVTEMDKVTQSNAANAEETASASEEMNSQAEEMKRFVDRLAEIVGGNRAGVSKTQPHNPPESKIQNVGNRRLVVHKTNPLRPRQAIPMDDNDFSEF